MDEILFFKLFLWLMVVAAATVTLVVCAILYSVSKTLKRFDEEMQQTG